MRKPVEIFQKKEKQKKCFSMKMEGCQGDRGKDTAAPVETFMTMEVQTRYC